MPIRNQIQHIVQTLSAGPGFVYGTTNELNRLADDQNFPCVFMHSLQPIELSPALNGTVSANFNVQLEFLFKTDFDQFTADNETYVVQALEMANEFLRKASVYREPEGKFFKIKSGDKVKCIPLYNKYDVNTTGVSLNFDLKKMYS